VAEEETSPDARLRDLLPLDQRIRNRREQLKINGAELAQRVGISPSYISLIEGGHKIPDADVAAKIAKVLGDDPDLYIAWAQARHYEARHLARLLRLERVTTDPLLRRRLAAGESLARLLDTDQEPLILKQSAGVALKQSDDSRQPWLEKTIHDWQKRLDERRRRIDEQERRLVALDEEVRQRVAQLQVLDGQIHRLQNADLSRGGDWLPSVAEQQAVSPVREGGRRVVRIPVLQEGADPALETPGFESETALSLDVRFVAGLDADQLFAYRIGQEAAVRLRDVVAEGDYLVLSRRIGDITPGRIHAIRRGTAITLTRAILKKNVLVLLASPGSAELELIQGEEEAALKKRVAGVAVLAIRRSP